MASPETKGGQRQPLERGPDTYSVDERSELTGTPDDARSERAGGPRRAGGPSGPRYTRHCAAAPPPAVPLRDVSRANALPTHHKCLPFPRPPSPGLRRSSSCSSLDSAASAASAAPSPHTRRLTRDDGAAAAADRARLRDALARLPPADVLPLDEGYLVVRRRAGACTQRYAQQLAGVRKLVRVRGAGGFLGLAQLVTSCRGMLDVWACQQAWRCGLTLRPPAFPPPLPCSCACCCRSARRSTAYARCWPPRCAPRPRPARHPPGPAAHPSFNERQRWGPGPACPRAAKLPISFLDVFLGRQAGMPPARLPHPASRFLAPTRRAARQRRSLTPASVKLTPHCGACRAAGHHLAAHSPHLAPQALE